MRSIPQFVVIPEGNPRLHLLLPDDREAYTYDAGGYHKVSLPELTIDGTPIRVSLAEVFSVLD